MRASIRSASGSKYLSNAFKRPYGHRLFDLRRLGQSVEHGTLAKVCVGINGDLVPPGERCASTTNRNFKGRQGPKARTHLMSPAMVAAAAVAGRLADVRELIKGRAQ